MLAANISSYDIFVTSYVAAPRAMIIADSSNMGIFVASPMAAPWAMPSADSSSVNQLDASHVAAQPDAGHFGSSVYKKFQPRHHHQCDNESASCA